MDSEVKVLNYTNYYVLQSDLQKFFTSSTTGLKYTLIFWVEVLAIIASLTIFYLPVLLQVLSYYLLGPSLTVEDQETMASERALLEEYNQVPSKFRLVCQSDDTLGIQDMRSNAAPNSIMSALTLTGQPITNCSALGLMSQ